MKVSQIKMSIVEKNVAKVVSGKPFVYWGEKNAFPNYLIDLFKYSSKHNAIVNGKYRYLIGEVEDGGEVVGMNGETLYDIFKECVFQYLIFGGFVLRKFNVVGKKFYEVLSFDKSRVSEGLDTLHYGKFINVVDKFKYKNNSNTAEIQVFSESDFSICFDNRFDDVYPTPEYAGAIELIELDYRITNFWNNFVTNNLSSGYLVNMFGKHGLSNEEKESIAEDFIAQFTSNDNAGKVIINFPSNRDNATTIDVIEIPDFVDKFNTLNDSVMQGIFIAHNITSPMLFGVRTEGQLGGRNELIDAFELFKNTYILPIRTTILNWLSDVIGKKVEFKFKDAMPLNIDVLQLKGILTTNEIREKLGYSPVAGNSTDAAAPNNEQIEQAKNKVFELMDKYEGSKYDEVLGTFDLIGAPSVDSEYRVLKNSLRKTLDNNNIQMSGVTARLTSFELNVLKTIDRFPKAPIDVITIYSGLTQGIVEEIITDLMQFGYLMKSEVDESFYVTTKGKKALADKNLIYTDVRYSYEWREGFSDGDKKDSRDFCKKLMKESDKRKASGKLWTRADIEKMSAEVGYDVWSMRGGWYRLPNTETSIPYCRHIWKQHIVIVKGQ